MPGELSEGQRLRMEAAARHPDGILDPLADLPWPSVAEMEALYMAGMIEMTVHDHRDMWRITNAGRAALSAASTGADDAG